MRPRANVLTRMADGKRIRRETTRAVDSSGLMTIEIPSSSRIKPRSDTYSGSRTRANGVAAGCFTSDQAGKQIDFVMGGNGDEQVGILHAGFTQNVIAGAAALYCSKVVCVGQFIQTAFGQVNQCQVVSGRAELSLPAPSRLCRSLQ